MNSLYFVIIMMLVFSQVGRKIGWALSKKFVYGLEITLEKALVFAFGWCVLIFVLDTMIINYFHPYWIVKWIFGYALGAYVASPNFGLVDENTIPIEYEKNKSQIVQTLPQALFIVLAIVYEVYINFF